MKEIINDAKARDPEHKRVWVVLMDAALHLWGMLVAMLKDIKFVGILDIIHVTEYLWTVANALYGESTVEGKSWVYEHLLAILQGHVGRVIGGMKQILTKRKLKASKRKSLEDAITYFTNHRPWMRYNEYLAAGYPIGTGVVESSCGHVVQDRMEGTGRRWSIEGAEATLLLRSIYTSNDWHDYWDAHRGIEQKRLYGKVRNALGEKQRYAKAA